MYLKLKIVSPSMCCSICTSDFPSICSLVDQSLVLISGAYIVTNVFLNVYAVTVNSSSSSLTTVFSVNNSLFR